MRVGVILIYGLDFREASISLNLELAFCFSCQLFFFYRHRAFSDLHVFELPEYLSK